MTSTNEPQAELAAYIKQCLTGYVAASNYAPRLSIATVTIDNLSITDQFTKLTIAVSGEFDDRPFSHTAKSSRNDKKKAGGSVVKLVVSTAVTATASMFGQDPQLEQCANEVIAKHEEHLDKIAGYDGGPLVRHWKKWRLIRWAIAILLYVALVACFHDHSGGGPNRRPPSLVAKLLIGLFLPGIPIYIAGMATQVLFTPSCFFTDTPRGRRLQALSGVSTSGQLKSVALAFIAVIVIFTWYITFVFMTNWSFVNPF